MKIRLFCSLLLVGQTFALRRLYEELDLHPYSPSDSSVDNDVCVPALKTRFDTSSAKLIVQRRVVVLMNVRYTLDSNVSNQPILTLKVQDLDSTHTKIRTVDRLPYEACEVRVGFLLNEVMNHYCPTGLPRIGSMHESDDFDLDSVSRFVGFVRTIDFGFCSGLALEPYIGTERERFKYWLYSDRYTKRADSSISELFIALETLNDHNLRKFVADPTWLFPVEPNEAWEAFDAASPDLKSLRPNLDPLRAMFIQVLSTLWYATSVEFTHWDFHMDNIMAHRVADLNPTDNFFFDIMPFDNQTRSIIDAPDENATHEFVSTSKQQHYQTRKNPSSQQRSVGGNSRRKSSRRYSADFAAVAPKFLSNSIASPAGVDGLFNGLHMSRDNSVNNLDNMQLMDDESDDEDDLPANSVKLPLVRFKVPVDVTKGKVFKIIDFGRSRARGPRDERIFGSFTKDFDPSRDLYMFAIDLITQLDVKSIVRPFLAREAKKHLPIAWRNEVEREYSELREFIQIVSGWSVMNEPGKQYTYEMLTRDLQYDLDFVKKSDWLIIIHKAFTMKVPPTTRNPEGVGETLNNFESSWVFKGGAKPSNEKDMLTRGQHFKHTVAKLLRHNFLSKFRIDNDDED